MENNQNSFSYTYSAKEQSEVEEMVKKYVPSENKLQRLRELDRAVTLPGTVVSICIGVIGILIFGLGLCFCLGELEISSLNSMLFGIILACVGIIPVAIAYPVYSAITGRQRKKFAPEILRLSNEILGK